MRAETSAGQPPPVGVLAIQGSYPLHRSALERCGAECREVRRPRDLDGLGGLIIPGGESTTMALLAREYGLFDAIRDLGRSGLPMFGTCAGAILLGRGSERPERLEVVDIEVERNAYGRQVDSFSAELRLAPFDAPFHGIFIRAPKLRPRNPAPGVEVLGEHAGCPVLVRSGSVLLATFHPELTGDPRIHRLFLELCGAAR